MNERLDPQPAPTATDERPVWELVMHDVLARGGIQDDTANLLIEDMCARDAQGRAKYGLPLQATNGRDHLVDAYQESLDLCVYLRAGIVRETIPDRLYNDALVLCAQIRELLNDRDGR